jgi:CRISPR/Cas system-associated protein Cas5 (RAMP superfamily)
MYQRIIRIQKIADKIIYNLKLELPDIDIDFIYSNSKISSRYISINLGENKYYRIRISDHESNKDECNYNLIIEKEEQFKLCSVVIDIVNKIKEYNEKSN